MVELLAVPAWDTPPTPLDAWSRGFEGQGFAVTVTREADGETWIELPGLRLRGYVLMEGAHVEAINFELAAADPAPARLALERAAEALAWELHEDDDGDDEDDDQPDR
jgi:hypothetical protein